MSIVFLILIIGALVWFLCDANQKEQTPAETWQYFINGQKDLGRELLSVAASQAWIEKHSDEIHLPNQIAFGEPYPVRDFGFTLYGIVIAVDPNGEWRVIAKKMPPEKTLLKVGDKLTYLFHRDATGHISQDDVDLPPKEKKDNVFVFEVKQTIVHPNTIDSFGADTFICSTYMSLEGATVSYNHDWVVTNIEGAVFRRNHDLLSVLFEEEPPQEVMPPAQQWRLLIKRRKTFGCKVLSVAASQAWIEKYKDEISTPNQIAFGEPYPVRDFGFALYGIVIAVDPNNKQRVIAKKLPPEKTLLKVGDPLAFAFLGYSDPNEFVEAFGDALNLAAEGRKSEAKALASKVLDRVLDRTRTFVFKAGDRVLRQGMPKPKKIEDDTDFMKFVGPDKHTMYTSPKGATLSYNSHGIVTDIEGTVFQRIFDFTVLATSLLE
jgi:hypothetical protein